MWVHARVQVRKFAPPHLRRRVQNHQYCHYRNRMGGYVAWPSKRPFIMKDPNPVSVLCILSCGGGACGDLMVGIIFDGLDVGSSSASPRIKSLSYTRTVIGKITSQL